MNDYQLLRRANESRLFWSACPFEAIDVSITHPSSVVTCIEVEKQMLPPDSLFTQSVSHLLTYVLFTYYLLLYLLIFPLPCVTCELIASGSIEWSDWFHQTSTPFKLKCIAVNHQQMSHALKAIFPRRVNSIYILFYIFCFSFHILSPLCMPGAYFTLLSTQSLLTFLRVTGKCL